MSKENLILVSWGAHTPVGHNTPLTISSVNANISRLEDHPYLHDYDGEPFLVARSPFIKEWEEGSERFLKLSVPALLECLTAIDGVAPLQIPIFLALPSPRPGLSSELTRELTKGLKDQLSESPHTFSIHALEQGHASGLLALKQVESLANEHEFFLIGGIDSYYHPETLKWLEAEKRIQCTNNSWGFIPGEGAGFLLFASNRAIQKYGIKPRARIIKIAVEKEEDSTDLTDGECLAKVFSSLWESIEEDALVHASYCDLNGERPRAEEFAQAFHKNMGKMDRVREIVNPVSSWGDQGAASVPLFFQLACRSEARGNQLIWASSDTGERAGALFTTAV